jgi:hypothetical protein
VLASQFVFIFRFGSAFPVQGFQFRVQGSEFAVRRRQPRRAPELRTSNPEPNLNTNRALRTEKRERHVLDPQF